MNRVELIALEAENPVAKAIKTFRMFAEDWARGREHGLIVSGSSGTGKTTIIEAVCRKHGLVTHPVNPHTYRDLLTGYEHARIKDAVVVLEDADHPLTTKRGLEVMLKAGEDRPERRWYNEVDVGVRWVVTTNLDCSNLSAWNGPLKSKARALFSRHPPFVIPHDRRDLWEYAVCGALLHNCIDTVVADDESQRPMDVPLEVQNAALEFFTHNLWNFDEKFTPSIRTLRIIAAKLAIYGPEKGRLYLSPLLATKPQPGAIPPTPRMFGKPKPRQKARRAPEADQQVIALPKSAHRSEADPGEPERQTA